MENVMVCRVCLATDVKLYDMFKNRLVEHYQILTGFQLPYTSNFTHFLCSYCATLLLKCVKFRSRCLHGQEILYTAECHGLLSTDYIRSLERDSSLLLPYTINHLNNFEYKDEPKLVDTLVFEEPIEINKVEVSVSAPQSPISFFNESTIKDEPGEFCGEETNETVFDDCNGILSSDEEPLSKKAGKRRKKIVKKKKKRHKNNENDIVLNENSISQGGGPDFDKTLAEDDEDANPSKNPDRFFNDEVEIVILTKEEQVQEIEARKTSRNYLNSVFKCDKCYKGFMSDTTFNNHMLKHDASSGPHECDICRTRWPDPRTLRTHHAATHQRKYICKRCRHVSRSSHAAREHHRWHDGHQYVCKVCGATFSKSTSHLSHLRTRHPSGAPCPICGEFFLGQYGLNMHRKKAHPNVQDSETQSERVCNTCRTEFKTAAALQTHLSGSKDNVCDPGLRSCIFCGCNLTSDQSLAHHIKEHHSTDKPVHCHECNRKFANARTYAVHRLQTHRGGAAGGAGSGAAGGPEHRRGTPRGALVCETCGLVARTRATLVYHQRGHTGEKPYQCADCPKRFAVLQRLQMHRRTHTGERPFQCPHCPKAFKQKAALNRHDRVHSGVKPYVCRHCGKRFTQSNSMKLHERAVHLKMAYRRVAMDDTPPYQI